jgi:hypothetical protein
MIIDFDLSHATPLTRIKLMLVLEREIKLLQAKAAALEIQVREVLKK